MANVGYIEFKDGACVQAWNPQLMTPKARKQIAALLEEIAQHLRADEFEEDGGFVKQPYRRTRKLQHKKGKS